MAIEVKRGRYIIYNDEKKLVLLEVRQASRYLKNNDTDKFLFEYLILDNNHKLSNHSLNTLLKIDNMDLSTIPDSINFRINREFPDFTFVQIGNIYFDLSKNIEKNKKIFNDIYQEFQTCIQTPLSYKPKQYNKGVCTKEELKQIFISLDCLEKRNNKKRKI